MVGTNLLKKPEAITYDVIGYKIQDDTYVQICEDQADKVILLLADATGHGIGPALSVTSTSGNVAHGGAYQS